MTGLPAVEIEFSGVKACAQRGIEFARGNDVGAQSFARDDLIDRSAAQRFSGVEDRGAGREVFLYGLAVDPAQERERRRRALLLADDDVQRAARNQAVSTAMYSMLTQPAGSASTLSALKSA